jgi:hypothetical protein
MAFAFWKGALLRSVDHSAAFPETMLSFTNLIEAHVLQAIRRVHRIKMLGARGHARALKGTSRWGGAAGFSLFGFARTMTRIGE